MKIISVSLALLSGLLSSMLLSSVAEAYVPPSQFIVKSMAKKKQGPKALRLKNNVVLSDLQRTLKETAWMDYSTNTVKSRLFDEAGRELFALERKLDLHAPMGDLLLLEARPEVVARALRSKDIPVRSEADLLAQKTEAERRKIEITSIQRWKGSIAWAIGKIKGSDKTSQLWVEKDSFEPLRFIQPDDEGLELQFENYKTTREIPYPRLIALFEGEKPVLKVESVEFMVNPDSAELKSPIKPGFTEAGATLEASVQDAIKKFYQRIR